MPTAASTPAMSARIITPRYQWLPLYVLGLGTASLATKERDGESADIGLLIANCDRRLIQFRHAGRIPFPIRSVEATNGSVVIGVVTAGFRHRKYLFAISVLNL